MIKGDQSIWWVFNDAAGLHRFSNASPMGVEVQAMAYAEASTDVNINNATYYDFKITNQSGAPLLDSYMGLWVDFDLGCYEDDYIGYNRDHQMMFAYNADEIDGSSGSSCSGGTNTYGSDVPIIGIAQIENSEYPTSSFTVFNRANSGTNLPNIGFEIYNTLRGTWRDGTALTSGGNGYNPASTDTVSFLLDGDPSMANEWSMCTANLPEADLQSLMSTSMNTLLPGQTVSISYAVVFVESETYPCPSLERLTEATETVVNNVMTSTYDFEELSFLDLHPNPAGDLVNISNTQAFNRVQLLSISGQVIRTIQVGQGTTEYSLSIEDINPGMYFVSVINKFGKSKMEKLIVQR